MSYTTISLETLIESIEALSPEGQSLLFDKLHQRRLQRERQKNGETATKTESLKEAGNARLDYFKASQSGNFWGDEGKATYQIIIESESDGTISATLLGWPECKATGKSQDEAVRNLGELVNARLAKAEIVSVKLKSNLSENPWIRLAGKYKDDPFYDDFLADMQAYRRELDAEMEEYYSQDAEEVEVK